MEEKKNYLLTYDEIDLRRANKDGLFIVYIRVTQ